MNYSEQLKTLILASNSIAIFPSSRLDLDCVSSAILMFELCKSIKADIVVDIWSDFEIDDYHKFIAKEYVFNSFDKKSADFTKYDLGIIVDGSTLGVLLKRSSGKLDLRLPFKLVILDHHSENNTSDSAEIKIIDSKKNSTTEVIWEELVVNLKLSTDKLATLALTGYLGDTQMLRWVKDTSDLTFFNKLILAGADFKLINNNYYNLINYEQLISCFKLISEYTKEISKGYYFITIPLKFEQENNLSPKDFTLIKDYLIIQLQNIVGWKLIVTIKQAPNDFVWLSLRSKEESKIDCSYLCRELAENGKGGGHERSAGANFKMSFEDAVTHTKEVVNNYLNNIK